MKKASLKRSGFHINTLPPWNIESLADDFMILKDPREALDALIQLKESGCRGPNLYNILATIGNSSIKLKIPDTLIKLKHQSTVYLYNDDKGMIRSKTDENCLSTFFENTKIEKTTEGYPNYIHVDDTCQVCIDFREALHWWAVCKSETHMLQKFVVPNKQRLQKIRVYWKAKQGLRFVVISSLSVLPKINLKKKKYHTKHLGVYQHKITDYTFAGRLFRTSFDPSLPNRSLISGENSGSVSQRDLNEIEPSVCKNFVIRFNDQFNCVVKEINSIEEIKEMMNVILQIINAGISFNQKDQRPESQNKEKEGSREGDNLMTSELAVDFMLSREGVYHFLQCKHHKVDYIPSKYSALFPMKTLSYNYFTRTDEALFKHSSEPFLTVSSLTSRLNTLGKKSKEFYRTKKLPPSLESITEMNTKLYISNFYTTGLNKVNSEEIQRDKYLKVYSAQINNISEHYDLVRFNAKRNKVETKRRKTLLISENHVENATKNIIDRLEAQPDLKKVAEIAESFLQQFLVRALEDEKNLEFFLKFQNHSDWKISSKQFRLLSSIIAEECQKAKLFSPNEFLSLNRSLQILENFIFRRDYNNA